MADVSQIKLPNGSVYDLIDEKSGYITAEYIENKTDYEIPVSRVGEIVVGETAIGTDSTNFPTSKAVVDYVDERVVQEMDAIDVGVTGIQANGTSLSVVDGVVNIPAVGPNQLVGLMTDQLMQRIWNRLNSIPTSTSQLTNDSGFITASEVSTNETDPTVPSWAKASTKPTYTASEVGALPSDTVIPEDKVFIATYNSTTYADTLTAYNAGKLIFGIYNGGSGDGKLILPLTRYTGSIFYFEGQYLAGLTCRVVLILQTSGWSTSNTYGNIVNREKDITSGDALLIRDSNTSASHLQTLKASTLTFGTDTTQYLANNGTWQSIPTVPTTISSFTNDSGYLTASDIASVMTYKGTKANYAALPASGNTTGDVWHLTDTGAEWAWDGSAWQELGTAIDLSNYLTTSDIAAWAKASTKPTYTAAEVGALPDSTVIPSKTSDLTNDSGFLTTDSDEKLKISQANDSTDYYLILGVSNTTATTRQYDRTGLKYYRKGGTADDSNGTARLTLGNNTASNTTGWMAGYLDIYGSTAYRVTLKSGAPTTDRVITLPDASGTIALTSDIPDTSSFLTSETDPVFSASAAAGITSTDISNWNAKVSDTGKWNGVELANFETATANDYYVPAKTTVGSTSGTASWLKVTRTPGNYSIAQYDNGYLKSTTPSANDNSTKVATTAYVDAAIPDTSGFVSKSGDTMTGKLVLNYNNTNNNNGLVIQNINQTSESRLSAAGGTGTGTTLINRLEFETVNTSNGIHLDGIETPTGTSSGYDKYAANKKYVDDSIPKVYSSTNTGGYLTMATLPIYDGTVV